MKSLPRLARTKLKYALQQAGIWRLTHQYSIYLTVCLWAITTHPRIGCQCVRVEPKPGQEWSKAAEERQRGLSGPNYIQSWENWQTVKQERSSWWEQQARWAKVAWRHFWLHRDIYQWCLVMNQYQWKIVLMGCLNANNKIVCYCHHGTTGTWCWKIDYLRDENQTFTYTVLKEPLHNCLTFNHVTLFFSVLG